MTVAAVGIMVVVVKEGAGGTDTVTVAVAMVSRGGRSGFVIAVTAAVTLSLSRCR